MLPDLEFLIQLQRLDDGTARARQTIAGLPGELVRLHRTFLDLCELGGRR